MSTKHQERRPRPIRYVAVDLGEIAGLAAGTSSAMLSRIVDLRNCGESEPRQMRRLFEALDPLALHFRPDVVAIRSLGKRKDSHDSGTAPALLEAVRDWAGKCGAVLAGHTSPQIRQAFAGRGNASNGEMVLQAWAMGFAPLHAREAYAIALLRMAMEGRESSLPAFE